MNATATTTVSVLRGTTTDDYGDPVDSNTAVATGIPASIIEQRQTVTTADDPNPRVVRTYTGRVSAGTDIRTGDRIKDERTTYVYIVDQFSQVSSPVLTNDLRLDLRRTT